MPKLPSNWQVKSLGEVVKISKGKKLNSLVENKTPSSKRFIQIDDLRNSDGLKYTEDKSGVLVNKKDVLIAWDGANAGTIGFGLDGFIGSTIARLEILDDSIFTNYFGLYLRTKSKYLRDNSTGATIPHINKSVLESLKIPLPPLPIQKQIAEILEKADQAKQKRKEANKLTDEFQQSVFIEMFGDPGSNHKGYGIKKIKDLVAIPLQNGAYFTKDKYTDKGDEGVEMVHMADAFYKTVQTGGLKKVIVDESEKVKYELRNNDILIARRSLTIEGAAQACLVKVENTPLIYESSFIRIRVNEDILSPIFVFHFLSNDRARKAYVQKYITSSTISGINQSNLAEVEILIPPLSLQQKFAEIVNKTETLKEKQKQSELELESLFQSLMQKAFKGELIY